MTVPPGEVQGRGAAMSPPAARDVPSPIAEAFARPPGVDEPLQRPPRVSEVHSFDMPSDPWRDPRSDVRLGEPADEMPPAETRPLGEGERFTLREALYRRQLRPGSLALLALGALLIGALGAAAGVVLTPKTVSTSTGGATVTLATAQPAVARPAGSVADIAARVLPSVVSIEVRVASGGETGSGVVIDGAGYILTNSHVVTLAAGDSATLTVVFNDGKSTRAVGHVVGHDAATDLAVVKVDQVDGLTVASLGASESLQVGDTVIAVGSPLGLAGTVTTGIVSALHRPVRLGSGGADTEAVIDAIQTDAAVNPGNSGGPLVDASGAVVGINTAIRTLSSDPLSGGSIGLGFAIPIDMARGVAETLIAHGTVTHATLGVNTRSATDGAVDGAQVQNVADGGPAATAGIAEGDVIVAVGDRTVRSADELVVAVQQHAVGDQVDITLLRDGRRMTVTATLGPA